LRNEKGETVLLGLEKLSTKKGTIRGGEFLEDGGPAEEKTENQE